MLTKGDVLKATGAIKDARGSAGKLVATTIKAQADEARAQQGSAKQAAPPAAPLTASEIRNLIISGLERAARPAKSIGTSDSSLARASHNLDAEFAAIVEPYESLLVAAHPPQPAVELPSVDLLVEQQHGKHNSGAVKDEWEGLF